LGRYSRASSRDIPEIDRLKLFTIRKVDGMNRGMLFKYLKAIETASRKIPWSGIPFAGKSWIRLNGTRGAMFFRAYPCNPFGAFIAMVHFLIF